MAAPLQEYAIKLRQLHAAQEQIKREARRYNVVNLGRRTGKTVLGLDLVIDPVLLEGFPAAWVAPKYKLAKEVFVEAKSFLKPITSNCNSSDMRIELVTGGVLEFWTLEDPDVGRGRKYKRLIVDEAAMARHLEQAWQQSLQPTLMDYRGDAFFLSTPKGIVGPGKFFKELFERGRDGGPDRRKGWKSWQMPTSSNPYIHPDEIEQMRLDMPDLVFRQEVLAEFIDFGGTMVKREWIHAGVPPPLSEMRVYMAVDLAISTKDTADFTACAVIGVEASGRIWILYLKRARVGFYDALQMIESIAMKYRPLEIGVEKVQYQAAAVEQLLRTTTLPVRAVVPDRDKLMRFQPLQVRYQNNLVYHAEDLIPDWLEELLSFPLGDNDDMVDAVAYAFSMAGDFGRNQIHFQETPSKEVIKVDVQKSLPGLPPIVAEQLSEIQQGMRGGGDTCGGCSAYVDRMCTARGFFVGPKDPACPEFIEIEAEFEDVGVDAVVNRIPGE